MRSHPDANGGGDRHHGRAPPGLLRGPMTPFAHAPVLGIHRLAGADVGTYLDLTMRYARAVISLTF